MSRTIDTSDLSNLPTEDLRYLRDRGRLTPEQEREYLSEEPRAQFEGAPKGEYRGDVNPTGAKPVFDSLSDAPGNTSGVEAARQRAEADARGTTEEVDYEEMTNDELRDELRARNLKTGGGKEELVARLESDDESDDEE